MMLDLGEYQEESVEYHRHHGASRRLPQRRADQRTGSGAAAPGLPDHLAAKQRRLLQFIEHNPRICGVIFDWDEYSVDLCSDINQLNEYLPLYAFINAHSTMDVSSQDCA
ncbi:Lysine decarboxylase 2, constitutive [Klebsiella pneumoniae]|uniref:Lysine decarboxylase 2, constitutive n=1 Tax=Klebsiella pneumoniae TaxID=573 RepID=A0A377WFN3_KLEPN|nr:Lysine decarboxylase 2, constitutive [Klebsiella pneumoniae]